MPVPQRLTAVSSVDSVLAWGAAWGVVGKYNGPFWPHPTNVANKAMPAMVCLTLMRPWRPWEPRIWRFFMVSITE